MFHFLGYYRLAPLWHVLITQAAQRTACDNTGWRTVSFKQMRLRRGNLCRWWDFDRFIDARCIIRYSEGMWFCLKFGYPTSYLHRHTHVQKTHKPPSFIPIWARHRLISSFRPCVGGMRAPPGYQAAAVNRGYPNSWMGKSPKKGWFGGTPMDWKNSIVLDWSWTLSTYTVNCLVFEIFKDFNGFLQMSRMST